MRTKSETDYETLAEGKQRWWYGWHYSLFSGDLYALEFTSYLSNRKHKRLSQYRSQRTTKDRQIVSLCPGESIGAV
jgi:hypothetical protein